jgi:predicted SAM-dependent methyltransferase
VQFALIKKHGFKKAHETYHNWPKAYEKFGKEHKEDNVFRKIVQGKGLDIGCGQNKEPEACGVDAEVDGKKTQADIIGYGDNLINFENNSQDYIIARHIIEHFHNPFKTLREWYRVLKPGGKLGLSTSDGKRWQAIECDGDHKHQYDRETMVELLETTGFKILELDTCMTQLNFYVIAEKI